MKFILLTLIIYTLCEINSNPSQSQVNVGLRKLDMFMLDKDKYWGRSSPVSFDLTANPSNTYITSYQALASTKIIGLQIKLSVTPAYQQQSLPDNHDVAIAAVLVREQDLNFPPSIMFDFCNFIASTNPVPPSNKDFYKGTSQNIIHLWYKTVTNTTFWNIKENDFLDYPLPIHMQAGDTIVLVGAAFPTKQYQSCPTTPTSTKEQKRKERLEAELKREQEQLKRPLRQGPYCVGQLNCVAHIAGYMSFLVESEVNSLMNIQDFTKIYRASLSS